MESSRLSRADKGLEVELQSWGYTSTGLTSQLSSQNGHQKRSQAASHLYAQPFRVPPFYQSENQSS